MSTRSCSSLRRRRACSASTFRASTLSARRSERAQAVAELVDTEATFLLQLLENDAQWKRLLQEQELEAQQQAKQKAAQRSCDLATLAENLVSEGRLQIQLDRKGWDRQGQIKISVVHNNHDGRLYFTKAGLHHDAWPAPRRVNSKQKRDHRVGGDTGPTRRQQVALHLYGVSSVAAYQRSLTLTPVHQQDFPLPWSHVEDTWDTWQDTWQTLG